MPNAPTHDFITLTTAAAADLAYFKLTAHPEPTLAFLFTASYIFAGYACAGDLDLNSREYRRWGRMRFLWWPYRQLVPHRSPISHGLLLGGVVRILYLSFVCTLLFWTCVWLWGRLGQHVNPDAATRAEWRSILSAAHAHPKWTLSLLTGFVFAGSVHSISDSVSTWVKRKF